MNILNNIVYILSEITDEIYKIIEICKWKIKSMKFITFNIGSNSVGKKYYRIDQIWIIFKIIL